MANSGAEKLIATALASTGMLVEEINGAPAASHPLAAYLQRNGYAASPAGFQMRRA